MDIRETVFKLQNIFDEMGETFSAFQRESGLSCPTGCGKCCLYPEIESTILECLPFALDVHRKGELDQWLEKIQKADSICAIWEGDRATGMGRCTSYTARPSVCRVFGASGYYDKNGAQVLSICKVIRETHMEIAQKVVENSAKEKTPMITHWYARIQALGQGDLLMRRPINEAIHGALELIGFYAQYQDLNPISRT